MRFSPAVKLAGLAGLAVGTVASALLISSGSHASQPTQVVIRQDAATGSISSAVPVVTSSAPVKRVAAPKPATSASTVVVKQPAVQQEAPVVTDPTSDSSTAAPPSADSSAPAFEPIRSHPGNGAPSSTSAISVTSPPDGDPSH